MASIRIKRFAGLVPEVAPRLLSQDHAQIAHNTLLWDGQLKPMPTWTQVASTPGITGIAEDQNTGAGYQWDTRFTDLIWIGQTQELYGVRLCGINNEVSNPSYRKLAYNTGVSSLTTRPLGLPVPLPTSISQVITNRNQSVYPIQRTYALTYMSNNQEGPPKVFTALGTTGGIFEGDYVTFTIVFSATELNNYGVTGFRLYRTIPGFDTSEQVANPLETGFHLVDTFLISDLTGGNTLSYVDTRSASQISADLLLTQQFQAPQITNASVARLQKLESGWLVLAQGATLQVSDRYLWHAWPEQYIMNILSPIQDIVAFYDEVFIGTLSQPYHLRVQNGGSEEGDSLNLTLRPYPDKYKCIPFTMVASNAGAIYSSPDGLIALSADGDTVTTKKLMNPGDTLFNPSYDIEIADTTAAAWWNGFYLGFTGHSVGYLYNQENSSNNEFPLGQLVTYDTPAGNPGVNVTTGQFGVLAVWNNAVYKLPMPGYGYENATKQLYTWRSKKFVFPGTTNMSAAKVVHSRPTGFEFLQFNLYADGVLLQNTVVTDSKPFRLHHQNNSAIELEVELYGDAVVSEVHVATSMIDLGEEEGHG